MNRIKMIIADGSVAFLRASRYWRDEEDEVWTASPLEERDALYNALRVGEAWDAHVAEHVITPAKRIQQQTADRLGAALNSIAPGLTDAILRVAKARMEASTAWSRPKLPPLLQRSEYVELATAWLYWNVNSDGKMLSASQIGKFSMQRMVQAVPANFPAEGIVPCPCCGQNADLKVSWRFNLPRRGAGSLRCSFCGHHETVDFSRSRSFGRAAGLPDSVLFECGCDDCQRRIRDARVDLIERLKSLSQRLAAMARAGVLSLRDEIPGRQNRLAQEWQSIDDWFVTQVRPRKTAKGAVALGCGRKGSDFTGSVFNFIDDVRAFADSAPRGVDFVLEPLVDIRSDREVVEWIAEHQLGLSWSQICDVPEDAEGFRKWLRALDESRLLEGMIYLPVTVVAEFEKGDKLQQSARSFSKKEEGAIRVLKSMGYRIIDHNGTEIEW